MTFANPQTKQGRAPLGIVKRTEDEFAEWVATEGGFLQAFGSYDENPLRYEPYQLAFLDTNANFRATEKSRQVGYSFLFAGETLARAHLRNTYTAIFVSYNLADAKEKISYVQQMHEELPLSFQKKKTVDSKLEIGFVSNGSSGKTSRIISNPSKAPRGKNGDIYLDELAHCANDKEIYKGSTALVLRKNNQLTICSSPLGKRGTFWEIMRQEIKPYKMFWRQHVPWWICSQFCTDIKEASRMAPHMDTATRVAMFGTVKLKSQFESLPLEDFQQEFEVLYLDEATSYFPYELIIPCTEPTLEVSSEFEDVVPRGRLTAGFDVGREKDLSVLSIFDEYNGKKHCVLIRKYNRVRFGHQESDLKRAMDMLPIVRLSIDKSSVGMQLSENLSLEYPQVVRESFSNASKEIWCTDFKIQMQRRSLVLPRERELIGEIHSIKKKLTPSGNVVFEAERTRSGHADTFWSMALACRKERGELWVPPEVGVTIIG